MFMIDADRPKCWLAAAVLIVTGALAGCSNVDRAVATSPVPDDFRIRHPVTLVNAPRTLDIFLNGNQRQLDERQSRDVSLFATDYQAHGSGRIRVQVPRGRVDTGAVDSTLDAVRRALTQAGIRGDIEVGDYPVGDSKVASTIRLSFVKLQAKVASHCGDWPEDLASGGSAYGWDNRSYYNLGCSTRSTLAAQIDDPRDLVRPRVEDPSDVQMRTRAIGDIRGEPGARFGFDPGTHWSAPASISSVGGN